MKKLIFALCAALTLGCPQTLFAQPTGLIAPGQVLGNPLGVRAPARGMAPGLLLGPTPSQPSSGNLVGQGCAGIGQILGSFQNVCIDADVVRVRSTDPSGGLTITLGGTVTVGDRVRLTFTFGSVCAAGCNVDYTTIGGDTLQVVSNALACGIANDTRLFNINGLTCTTGAIVATPGQAYGGYATKQFGYVVAIVNGLAIDFDSRVPMMVTANVNGAATETVTLPASCATVCSKQLDNNPVIQLERFVSGTAPAPYSIIAAIYAIGNTSTSLTALNVNYGAITHQVINSTNGATASQWTLQTINTAGALGPFFRQAVGAYTTNGADVGIDTVSAPVGFFTGPGNIYAVKSVGSTFQIHSDANPITFDAPAGVGVNVTPTSNTFTSGVGFAVVTGTQAPTIGSGIGITGGATPAITAKDFAAATLPLRLNASSVGLSAAGTLTPLVFANATSGTITLQPVTGALGSVTLSLPAATDTLVGKATTDTLTNKTIGAATLSGTLSGGGNQINNVVIGTTTPLAGTFTTLAAAATTLSGQLTVSFASANITLTDSGTSFSYFQTQNLGATNTARFGAESAAGGGVFTGSTALATVIGSTVNQPVEIFTNNTKRLSISGAGAITVNGNAAVNATKTVRASGGAADCTLIFTQGILTGGTC